MKKDHKTLADAFAYYTDCALATAESNADMKSVSKGEKARSMEIAKGMVEMCRKFEVDTKSFADRIQSLSL
jgi:hypothetical protein